MVTAENVARTLSELGADPEPDLLSIDVDRNTWFIWEALAQLKPRLAVVEYNALYPAAEPWKVEYDSTKSWTAPPGLAPA